MPNSDRSLAARLRLARSRGVSLTTRILAVNVIALALLAGSFFYLDSYRKQLLAERFKLARAEAEIAAASPTLLPAHRRRGGATCLRGSGGSRRCA